MSTTPTEKNANIVYKFLPAEAALRVLEQQRLKVTRLTELNDVFDCCPKFERSDGQPWTEAWNEEQFQSWAEWVGILCFSRACLSPHMWGHYADHGRGIALGFDMNLSGLEQRPIKVTYDKDRRPTVASGRSPGDTLEEKTAVFQNWFGTKAGVWSYEDEVRYVIHLGGFGHAWASKPEGGMYFYDFPKQALKRVIVGYRSQITDRYLMNVVALHYPHPECQVEVKIARPCHSQYEMYLGPAF